MKYLYLTGWAITRAVFMLLWALTEPVGELNVWFKQRWLARSQ